MRVSMSAIGSVMLNEVLLSSRLDSLLPARLRHAGDLAFEGQPAETDPAHGELTDVAARTATEPATIVLAHGKLRRPVPLDYHRDLRHAPYSLPLVLGERHAEKLQQ